MINKAIVLLAVAVIASAANSSADIVASWGCNEPPYPSRGNTIGATAGTIVGIPLFFVSPPFFFISMLVGAGSGSRVDYIKYRENKADHEECLAKNNFRRTLN